MRIGAVVVVLVLAGTTAQASKYDLQRALKQLNTGATAFRDGRYEDALKALEAIDDNPSFLALDYKNSMLAEARFLTGDVRGALKLNRKLAQGTGELATTSAWRVADCLFELNDPGAKAAYEKLIAAKTPGGEIAVAKLHLAELVATGGNSSDAAARMRQIYLDHPAHPITEMIPARILVLTGKALELTPKEHIRRAQLLTSERHWDRAMMELAKLPPRADLPQAIQDQADYWEGTTLYKMRRQYARAGELLLKVHERMGDRRVEAMFHGARAMSRADNDDLAIEWYQKLVAKHPTSTWAAEAQYLSGWLEYNRGNYEKSQPGLEKLLKDYGDSKFADDALWFLGFGRWMLKKPAEALPFFEKLAAKNGELLGGKGRYWKARALAAMGQEADAITVWKSIPAAWPLSHYAQLARQQLAERNVTIGPFGEKTPSSAGVPKLLPIDAAIASEPAVRKADQLIAAGLTVEAGDELRKAEAALKKKYGAMKALPLLFDRYHQAENFNRPFLLGEGHNGNGLDVPPLGDARIWWEVTHPLAYRALVEKWQDVGKNPPYYLYTIMKKESGFNAHDASYADALGLLQMIPPTTRRVAKVLGIQYSADLLYDPSGNIRTGSFYIGSLVQKFRGQIPVAAGSYNAGPKAMIRWLERSGVRPFDEFVELVAFFQTREYIKKVVGIYSRYLYLYEKQDFQLPKMVNPDYLKDDGIDY